MVKEHPRINYNLFKTPTRSPPKSKGKTPISGSSKRTSTPRSVHYYIRNRVKRRRIIRGGRALNVSADKEFLSKTYKKRRITKKQQRIINRRFKNGYSPFVNRTTNVLQEVSVVPSVAKWIWRTGSAFSFVRNAFATFPQAYAVSGGSVVGEDKYHNSETQSLYFSQIKHIYELRNPTNYDINLVIYDIVYKEDTDNNVSAYSVNGNSYPAATDTRDDPICLIARGLTTVEGRPLQSSDSNAVIVADPNDINVANQVTSANLGRYFGNLELKPTDSYAFNIYCKIVKKHKYRLQPGATMTHIFNYNPKALMKRGYMGYKYKKYFTSSSNDNIGIKGITCGCLFKVSGQILGNGGTGSGEQIKVATGSGNIEFRETIEQKWYTMDDKFKYVFNADGTWIPTADEYATLENPVDVDMEKVDQVNTTTPT